MKILDRMATPAGITTLYVISGALWIAYSDLWFERVVTDIQTLSRLQSYKGWAYIVATAIALYYLLTRNDWRQNLIRANYLNVFRELPIPTWIYTPATGRIEHVNPAALSFFGLSLSRFLAQQGEPFFPTAGVHRFKDRYGEMRILEVTVTALEFDRKDSRLVMAQDITDEIAARTAVERMNRELEDKIQERTRELTIVNKELESFSYSVSHDLQAPLRAINGFGRELAERHSERMDEVGRGYLDRILKAAERMENLITELLSLARISRTEVRFVETAIGDVVRSVVDEIRAGESGPVRIDVDLDEGVVMTDPGLARIVFMNLIRNAVKFSSKRDQPRVSVGVSIVDGTRIWHVRDNGVGFDMAYYDKLFQPFQRLHPDRDYPGSGIGLATAHRVMRRLRGMIWAESKPDNGAVFYLKFPASS